MNLHIRIFIVILVILSISGCSKINIQSSASPQEIPISEEPPNDGTLKQACINAAIRGIELEIRRHQNWIDKREEKLTHDGELDELKKRFSQLRIDLEKFKNIELEDYKIPQKLQLKAWVNGSPSEDSILYIENMTRSGPWYHIVGIKGEDYTVLQPNEKYSMTIYLVYPRYYWHMKSYYIYIGEYEYNVE